MGRLDELYGQDYYRPAGSRLRKLTEAGVHAAIQKVAEKVPEMPGQGLPSQFWNLYRGAIIKTERINKHKAGREAGNIRNVPVLGKVVQDLWSVSYLAKEGVTTIDTLYGVRDGSNIYLIGIQADKTDEVLTPSGRVHNSHIVNVADSITGNEEEVNKAIIDSVPVFANRESIDGGAIQELTDTDIKGVTDFGKFVPMYTKAEALFIKARGKKDIVGYRIDGKEVVSIKTPGTLQTAAFHLTDDFYYTLYDSVVKTAEKGLGGIAAQREYESEVGAVINATLSRYGIPPLKKYGLS